MKIEKTFIDGLFIIQPDIFTDDRGYFYESFSGKFRQRNFLAGLKKLREVKRIQ